jgi:hypothetical protein
MPSASLIASILFVMALLATTSDAFVSSGNKQHRRNGARGRTASNTVTSPKTTQQDGHQHPLSLTALSMAPKKAAAKKKPTTPETLRKKDLVDELSAKMGITKVDADNAISAVFDIISDVSNQLIGVLLLSVIGRRK